MPGELAGKVAIITGGASGIGLGCAERFVAEGARVVVADVDRERAEVVVGALGSDAAFCATDVSDQSQIARLIAFAVERFGALDVMFNNAGISGKRHATLLDDDLADFHDVLGVNLLGVMAGTREAARHMAQHGGGSIINTTSIGGMQSTPSLWAYHASKVGVIMFSRSVAIELGQHAIRVNCIAPGNIETPILGQNVAGDMNEADRDAYMQRVRALIISRQPLQRQGTTDDIAEAALYFAGDRSRYVTGTVLPVDGGMVAGSPARSGLLNVAKSGQSQ
jgi:NAD(P)-dependent dehydrogenase (short-subunit alcohol dehydrogenase family)